MDTTTPGHRSWTDEQLRQAVASQTSWRGVARALGLKGTSAGVVRTIKRHATRLHLDSSHFTGQRRWTDVQLRVAVTQGTCWADVLRLLDVIDNADSRIRVKGHAARLQLDTSHLRVPVPELPPVVAAAAVDRSMLRFAAPSLATSWFMLRGCAVSLPVEPQEYDLLVTMPGGIKRVQVKSTTNRGADGKWSVGIGRRPYSLDKTAGKAPYDPDSLDYFFIVDGNGGLYLIPSRSLAGRVAITLDAYAPYRVGDAASLLA